MDGPEIGKALNALDEARSDRAGDGFDEAKIELGKARRTRLPHDLDRVARGEQQSTRFVQQNDA